MILVDSREQIPFAFQGYDVDLEPTTLTTGDYSIRGFQNQVSIERKGLDDLVSCLMNGSRQRFEKELSRARGLDFFAIVVEGALSDISMGKYRSEMKPQAALQSIITFQVRYRVPFLWCGNRAGAEYMTYWLLAKYLREIEMRYQQAVRWQKNGEKEKAA